MRLGLLENGVYDHNRESNVRDQEELVISVPKWLGSQKDHNRQSDEGLIFC